MRASVHETRQQNLQTEDRVRFGQHLPSVPLLESASGDLEGSGQRLLADLIQESHVSIEHGLACRELLEERIDTVCVPLQPGPVPQSLLPVQCKERRVDQFGVLTVVGIQP